MAKKKVQKRIKKKSKKVKKIKKSIKKNVKIRKSKKVSRVRKARKMNLSRRPLSQKFLFVGILGTLITIWWTYFGFEGKTLGADWGAALLIIFVVFIIASFRSIEIS